MSNLSKDQRFQTAQAIAEQIWREQQLTSSRMTWNLTYQGFLLAGFVLTFGQKMEPLFGFPLQVPIAAAGIAVAATTRTAVEASHLQRDYLKALYLALYDGIGGELVYPRPFADNDISRKGRYSPGRILLTIVAMWAFLLLVAVWLVSARTEVYGRLGRVFEAFVATSPTAPHPSGRP